MIDRDERSETSSELALGVLATDVVIAVGALRHHRNLDEKRRRALRRAVDFLTAFDQNSSSAPEPDNRRYMGNVGAVDDLYAAMRRLQPQVSPAELGVIADYFAKIAEGTVAQAEVPLERVADLFAAIGRGAALRTARRTFASRRGGGEWIPFAES